MLSSLSVILLVVLPVFAPAMHPNAGASASSTVVVLTHEARAMGVLATASRYLGTRYRFGGATPRAFDCSGFVRYVFARHGVALPRTAREQFVVGQPVVGGLDSLRAGDLLFFRTRRGRAAHVAIYVGAGRIIHASAGSRRVRYDDLASPRGRWFMANMSGSRRVLTAEASLAGAGIASRSRPQRGGRDQPPINPRGAWGGRPGPRDTRHCAASGNCARRCRTRAPA